MTLTALRIANFKAFAGAQRVPLRPITLIYGANSAGKSSILHTLALTHHAIETGQLDTQRTQIEGESIDLGGFRQYVHLRERQRQVERELPTVCGTEILGGLGGVPILVANLYRSGPRRCAEVAVCSG